MTVGYISETNPFVDRTAWSGLVYKIRESIENAGCEVVWISCRFNGKVGKAFKLINQRLHGPATMFEHTKSYYWLRAMVVDKKLIDRCDVLFCACGAQIFNYLDNKGKPIIYYSDTTFKLMDGYYWKKLTNWQFRTGNNLEANAIAKSTVNLRASKWAADSVVKDYGFPVEHTYIMEFGANIDECDIKPIIPYEGHGCLNILFSGVDFQRKGADVAIQTVRKLNETGCTAKLYLVGLKSVPEKYANYPNIVHVGYLNKSIPEQYTRYLEVLSSCHLLLLPTKAECAGIVFSEASAHGIPTLTYDTGGIGNYVLNGVNGYRLPKESTADDFAHKISEMAGNHEFEKLYDSCIQTYKTQLNWQVWSNGFREIVKKEFISPNK